MLYSDGLIERRGESFDVCLERLVAILAKGHLGAEDIVDRFGATATSHDDTVVMCVDVTEATARYHDLFDALTPAEPNGSGAADEVDSGEVDSDGADSDDAGSDAPTGAAGLPRATEPEAGASLH